MMDLGRHAAYIWASYGVVVVVLTLLIGWIVTDARRQRRILDELEDQGMTRRSARAGKSED